MKKESELVDKLLKEQNKKTILAIIIALFGIIFFIALALTLPFNGN